MIELLNNPAFILPAWALIGLIACRFTVGNIIRSDFHGTVDSGDEVMICIMFSILTMITAPLMPIVGVGWAIWKSPLWKWIHNALVWWFYLDRTERKRSYK